MGLCSVVVLFVRGLSANRLSLAAEELAGVQCGHQRKIDYPGKTGGRTLEEITAAASHGSLVTASAYLHIAVEDEGAVGEPFG